MLSPRQYHFLSGLLSATASDWPTFFILLTYISNVYPLMKNSNYVLCWPLHWLSIKNKWNANSFPYFLSSYMNSPLTTNLVFSSAIFLVISGNNSIFAILWHAKPVPFSKAFLLYGLSLQILHMATAIGWILSSPPKIHMLKS
jgi:hypothetical protein